MSFCPSSPNRGPRGTPSDHLQKKEGDREKLERSSAGKINRPPPKSILRRDSYKEREASEADAPSRPKNTSRVFWEEVGTQQLLGPELVQVTNSAVQKIKQRIVTAQSRQKIYEDVHRRDLKFEVGDHIFLKVAPMRGVLRYRKKGKLSPRFIGPFEILERVGAMAYRIALPPNLAAVHNVFHVSMLRKYTPNPTHVIEHEMLPLREDLSYEEKPSRILTRDTRRLRNKDIPLVKVSWGNRREEEATWEREKDVRKSYPELFQEIATFGNESS
ncbi:uncharacterized protein LOC111784441 [Cucurbita pepo subsp. pepo]|uniref:uncharacterized protein LOC111784441 n=1 Tax=Cucurbita pepo subsp. pepo TaxID=3664 RepID=UPI000C9D316C|nr:uncharacterized protein LOC111784441 [Cucurbita pepo subsp. pepo]